MRHHAGLSKLHTALRQHPLVVAALLIPLVLSTAVIARALVPGMAGGPTRSTLSFAGTLGGTSGPQTLLFTFHNGAAQCQATVDNVTPEAVTNHFQVEIPLDGCPAAFAFDGADVTVDVQVGSTLVVAAQPIQPVPYAKYADVAGQVAHPVLNVNGKAFSMFGYFRGKTSQLYSGRVTGAGLPGALSSLVGYPATKAICEASVGSPSAHMCTVAEMLMSASMGVAMPPATLMWMSTGVEDTASGNTARDCVGWSSVDTFESGVVWATQGASTYRNPTAAPTAHQASCMVDMLPLACCD